MSREDATGLDCTAVTWLAGRVPHAFPGQSAIYCRDHRILAVKDFQLFLTPLEPMPSIAAEAEMKGALSRMILSPNIDPNTLHGLGRFNANWCEQPEGLASQNSAENAL